MVRPLASTFTLAVLSALLWSTAAFAQAVPGTEVQFTLATTSVPRRSISEFRGRVAVVFYETRDTITQNQHVKDAIGALAQRDPTIQQRFALVPICNIAEFHFWPAEHFAREAITSIARQNRIELWIDWERALVQRYRLRDGASNILVLDRTGRVRFHHWGRMSPEQLRVFIDGLTAMANER